MLQRSLAPGGFERYESDLLTIREAPLEHCRAPSGLAAFRPITQGFTLGWLGPGRWPLVTVIVETLDC